MSFYNRIRQSYTENTFDAALIVSSVNRQYITGFKSSAGYVVVTPEQTCFFTDFRYFGSALNARANGKIEREVEIFLQSEKIWEDIGMLLKNSKSVLIEEEYLTLSGFESLKEKLPEKVFVRGASKALSRLRAVKTDIELSKIRAAQQITDKAFTHILGFLSDNIGKNGITERAVALELEHFMKANGADGVAFDTIAVSGKKSALPHGVPEDIVLSKGFLTMDFGACLNGYCSDMTRTVSIGKPSEKMKEVYKTVLDAQLTALDFISAGKTGKEIDFSARSVINSRGYEGKFGHSLGHSLGLEIHEAPNFSPNSTQIIPKSAVISVEPGIYLEDEFGVRIEDIVNITENGCINLTKSAKDLIVL